MSETRLRLAALSVLGGSLHGRRYSPEEVVGEILIGSDPSCHLVLDLPGISPIHAKIWTDLGDSKLLDTSAPRGVFVNTERVEKEARLDEGDVIWLGPPQEAGSVCLRCRFEPWVEVLPAPAADTEAAANAVEPAQAESVPEPASTVDEADGPLSPVHSVTAPAVVEHAELVAPTDEAFAPEPPEPEAQAVEPAASFSEEASEPKAAQPTEAPQPEPPEPAAVHDDDPFFLAGATADPPAVTFETEAPAVPADAGPAPAEAEVGGAPEPVAAEPPEPLEQPQPDEAQPRGEAEQGEPGPLAISDEWAITENPAEPAPAAGAPAQDDFFLTAEPVAAEAEAPAVAFIVPDAAADEVAPGAAAFLELPPLEPPASEPPVAAPPPASPAQPAAEPKPKAPAPEPTAPAPASMPSSSPIGDRPQAAVPAPEAAAAAPAPTRAPAAKGPAPASRPRPARRPAGPTAARRPAGARAAARASVGPPAWLRPVGLAVAGLVALVLVGFGAMKLLGRGVRLDRVEPQRVRVGQHVTLTGAGFGSRPGDQTVAFGEREAKVLQASATRLEVEVPEAVVPAGAEGHVQVVVKAGGRATAPVEVTVFQGPRLHGISPGAAMPGEEVMLAGAGWGVGATVRFGSAPAQTLDVQPTEIRALVPQGAGVPGSEVSVVVTVGGVDSNAAPFVIGHLPVVTGVDPASAAPGDVVTLAGRGFEVIPARNEVRIGGAPALVVRGGGDSLQVVVPQLGPGEATRSIELRVPGSSNVAQAQLGFRPPADPIEFRFVAEPFTPSPGHSYALLSTGLGPAFVLASSGGATAAERAAAAAERLNAAAQPLRTTLGLTLEARDVDSNPVIGLAGHPEPLLEVSDADAAAYNEDWTGLHGKGGPVTRARLARWWEALGRDLVLVTIRGQAPQYAAALAPEGRVLGQLFEEARRSGATGIPRQLVDAARAPLKEGLRLLGLRVPASVTATAPIAAAAAGVAAPATAAPTPSALQLDGTWGGSQVEQSQRQYLSVSFRGNGGTIAYEGGITLTVPMTSVEKPRRDQVHFGVQIRGGMRHYTGQWDGEKISGSVSTDAAGKNVVGTFELRRR
jgi:hypothetical protein